MVCFLTELVMDEKLQNTLIEILEYFKQGLDDVEEGSGERQTMQNEIDYALPLVKNLTIPRVKNLVCDHIQYCTEKKNKDGSCPKRCRHRNYSSQTCS